MRHRRCISAILMSFVLFLQPAYAVPSEENQPENSQENNTEDDNLPNNGENQNDDNNSNDTINSAYYKVNM